MYNCRCEFVYIEKEDPRMTIDFAGSSETKKGPGTLETKHVRVRVTQADLDAFKGLSQTNHLVNPITRAINRTLRGGYVATFDGLSVGLLCESVPPSPYTPSSLVFVDEDGYNHRRLHDDSTEQKPFFRGVSERVQKLFRNAAANRKTKPARITVSLPASVLKRTEIEHDMEFTLDE